MTAEEQIKSTLRRMRKLLGRRLTPAETMIAVQTITGWRALINAGYRPEQIVELARQEVEATSVH